MARPEPYAIFDAYFEKQVADNGNQNIRCKFQYKKNKSDNMLDFLSYKLFVTKEMWGTF